MSPLRRAAFAWAAGCSALFVVVYNACNWITSMRHDVGTWYLPWELKIPLVPWMILPYWSLDLFFLGGFFLCQNRAELDALGRRLALATLAAGACFLALPLTTAFPRPAVGGFYGRLFDALRSFDRPYNLFPSLHIALRTLLAAHYARHCRGLLRWTSHAWFSLIGFSTLFTWQHQAVDVAGGFLLATVCFHAFREEPASAPPARNPAVGRRYLAGAALCLLLAWISRPWGMLLLWPAYGLGWAAWGYHGGGGAFYRKEQGRLPLSARLLLAPLLLGHTLSRRHYQRACRPWDEVAPCLLVGRQLSAAEARQAVAEGVRAVVDLASESSENAVFRGLPRLDLPVLDLTAPTRGQLRQAVAFIRSHLPLGKVYVHCKIGYSRSAAAAAAYLLAEGLAQDPEDAIRQLRSSRPSIVIRPEIREALQAFNAEAAPQGRSD